MERLWTPWRASFVSGDQPATGNLFETLAAERNDEANLILLRGAWCFVIMNLFPYNTGHLMIVPYRKVADPAELTPDEWREMGEVLTRVTGALRETLRPEGFNIGMNVGRAAGAGIPDHIHLHVVPRWVGDTNFMPVFGSTKVLPEPLPETYARLRRALGLEAEPAGGGADERAGEDDADARGADLPAADTVAAAGPVAADADAVPIVPPGTVAAEGALTGAVADEVATPAPAYRTETGDLPEPAAEQAAAEPIVAPPAAPERAPDAALDAAPEPVSPPEPPPPPEPALPPAPQAGAVVLVRDKVALRLTKDQTWVLPKGHIEPGETPEQAAAREVDEEMGLVGRLGPFLDELRFVQGGRERQVRYYLLRAERHQPSWGEHFGRDTFLFNPREALARLTHDDAKAILARALEAARRP